MYKCPNCGARWTDDEFYETVDDNEDEVVMIQSCGMCPECWTGDIDDIIHAQVTDPYFDQEAK